MYDRRLVTIKLCQVINAKHNMAKSMASMAVNQIRSGNRTKINCIWLEDTSCSENTISLMNAEQPDLMYLLHEMVILRYNNSLMAAGGGRAYQQFLDTLDTDFLLIVEGAVSVKNGGRYNIITQYQGNSVTAMEAVALAGERAKYVLAVGTCASYGGISVGTSDPSGCLSVAEFLSREVIRIPGCPCHPEWVIGTIANIISFGKPQLDNQNRPIMFYGITVHDQCTRRSYFNKGIFAAKLGDKECMFQLGCRGPVTKTDCSMNQWNGHINWPVEMNTPYIGCAGDIFPDGMEPFIRY